MAANASDARKIDEAARQLAELMRHYLKTGTETGSGHTDIAAQKAALDAAYTTFIAA